MNNYVTQYQIVTTLLKLMTESELADAYMTSGARATKLCEESTRIMPASIKSAMPEKNGSFNMRNISTSLLLARDSLARQYDWSTSKILSIEDCRCIVKCVYEEINSVNDINIELLLVKREDKYCKIC